MEHTSLLAGSPPGAIRAAPNRSAEAKRVTTAGAVSSFVGSVWRWEIWKKLCPGDAIVEENSRSFGQPENMFLYLRNDCTIRGNISEAVGDGDVTIEVLGRVV